MPNVVTIVEPGWVMSSATAAADPVGAHYNPIDGLLYYGRRPASGGGGNLNRINADGSITVITTADRPSTVFVDPTDGDIFVSRLWRWCLPHRVRRDGGRHRATWLSGLGSGDDDPVGMAVAPAVPGPILSAGQALLG